MNIPSHAPLHLLHQASSGTLATHSREPHGYPYPTALPFAPTSAHVPMVLISHLAEHTRNLQSDARAGFLIAHSASDAVLEGQRLTMLGSFSQAPAESMSELSRRYLRYHPDAARYLDLGDFTFWVMSVERMRYIGGFGAMGWLDGTALDESEAISEENELQLLELFSDCSLRPAELELIGVDKYGCDLRSSGVRNRFTFDIPKDTQAELNAALIDCIGRHR
ncbi:HugZ family protein [Caballeronia sordidicola]|uniref:Putative heme iron utilization protein n=1 Tax=Caballeronia sordidicola TaxID=196367 RepID=A0A242M8J8_CABSO|nr:pyridoxamine 5'-phosphate oxidase family protein [Caballeronia sordidicola]OTP67585.1 putative heme iron utilization protein [Caballeronia sordidicola]